MKKSILGFLISATLVACTDTLDNNTEDNKEKVEAYNDLAMRYSNMNDKTKARDFYKKSLELDPTNKDAFDGVGNLYFNNASDCIKMRSIVEDRLAYIAAYDMYEKAGNQKMMKAAKAQFPSKEEIFMSNLESGDVMKVNCWINEEVALRTRN